MKAGPSYPCYPVPNRSYSLSLWTSSNTERRGTHSCHRSRSGTDWELCEKRGGPGLYPILSAPSLIKPVIQFPLSRLDVNTTKEEEPYLAYRAACELASRGIPGSQGLEGVK